MKTAELTGSLLDWAVAKCKGEDIRHIGKFGVQVAIGNEYDLYAPSKYWSQGGPIIEREGIGFWVSATPEHGVWCAAPKEFTFMTIEEFERTMMELPDPLHGSTPLIAAMRCYVSSKLGDEIEIPEELK